MGYTKACNYLQPSATTQKSTNNHQQPWTTTHKNLKITQKCQNYCALGVKTETDVNFDIDMKHWYIYMGVFWLE